MTPWNLVFFLKVMPRLECLTDCRVSNKIAWCSCAEPFFFSDKISEGNLTFQKRHSSAKKKKKKRKKELSSHSDTEFVPEPSTRLTASPRREELPDIIPRHVCQAFTPADRLSVSLSPCLWLFVHFLYISFHKSLLVRTFISAKVRESHYAACLSLGVAASGLWEDGIA